MRWFKQLRIDGEGVNLAADIEAVVAVNRGRPGEIHVVDSTSHVAVVQDSRRGANAGEQPPTDPKERR